MIGLFLLLNQVSMGGELNRQAWIAKSARALLSERHLPTLSEINQLSILDDEKILDQFVAREEFSETLYRFNLYFLGHPFDQIRETSGRISQARLTLAPSALTAARGSFDALFELEQPVWLTQVPNQGPDYEVRWRKKIETFQALIPLVEGSPKVLPKGFCDTLLTVLMDLDSFVPVSVKEEIQAHPLWPRSLTSFCVNPSSYKQSIVLALVKNRITFLTKFSQALIPLNGYEPRDIASVKSVDLGFAGVYSSLWASQLGVNLVNTKTNFNRRRGAYVLKHFFCEDLVPIPAAESGTGAARHTLIARDEHGANASCKSCHYRLDPIAGFFRFHGHHFLNFLGKGSVRLDDGTLLTDAEYALHWTRADFVDQDFNEGLNIGYVASNADLTENSYGRFPGDLVTILKSRKEVKACITQRALEFFLGKNQLVDPDFSQKLSEELARQWRAQSSSVAIRGLVKSIALSKAFKQQNPVSDTCYDISAGGSKAEPPCYLRAMVQRHCTQCHGQNSRLNLKKWEEIYPGEWGFPHLEKVQASAAKVYLHPKETFARILNRLTTADSGKRMPLSRPMPQRDREGLVLWLRTHGGGGKR